MFAIEHISHRRCRDARTGVELPQHFACFLIQRFEPAFDIAVEQHATRGRSHATCVGQWVFVEPNFFLFDWIPSFHATQVTAGANFAEVKVHAQIELAAFVFLLHAQVERRNVDQAVFGVVAHRHPVFATQQVGANIFGHALQTWTFEVACCFDGHACFQVNACRPVHAIHILLGRQEFAVGAINDVEETIAVGLHDNGHFFAIKGQVGEHQFVHAVIVPRIMRCELIVPNDVASFWVQSNHRCGVQVGELADIGAVVAANCCGPRGWVAGAVVNQVQLGIVRAHVPGHSAAVLGRIAFPCVAIFLAWQWHGVGAPHFFTGGLVQRNQRAACAVFTTAVACDDQVFNDSRRRCDDRALCVVHHFGVPQLFAGFHIQGNNVRIQATHEHFAVIDCNTAVVHVATCVLINAFRNVGGVLPTHFTCFGIHCKHVFGTERRSHDQAVAHQNRC